MKTETDQARRPRRHLGRVPRYGCAVASVAAALVGTRVLGEQTAGVSPLFFAAVAVSAWYGGLGPGLLSTALAGWATAFFLFEPAYSLRTDWDDLIRVAAFCLVALLIGVLHETSRREHARAVAANHAKDRFLAVVSHELRNPLHPILTVASMLESDARLPEDVRDDLRIVGRSARMQLRLVDDLLDLHRIARGKLALVLDVVDAHELAEEVVAMCRSDAAAKGVALEGRLAAGRHHLRGDGARLRQVLWNLVRNAVKFTPAGGRVVVTSADGPGGCFRLHASDTGVGIERAALGRIFEAFEQEAVAGSRSCGLGLGLAIARSLAEAHGGTLSASSPGKGHGATFQLTLPTVEPPTPPPVGAAREVGRPAVMGLAAND
jgi:signal transduction histidine kinase